MKTSDMAAPFPIWNQETFVSRLEKCRITLKIHGFLSDAENMKVKRRIEKQWDGFLASHRAGDAVKEPTK